MTIRQYRPRGLYALAVLILLAFAPSGLFAQTEQQIIEIEIKGNTNISRDAILATIQEKPGTPYDAAKAQADRKEIEAMGFFQVVSTRQETVPGGVRVIFEVVENPKIKAIEFTGATVFTRDELLEVMRTKEGQVFNMNTWEQDVKAIEESYRKLGNLAYVTADADMNAATGILTIPVLEFRVGQIKFTGLKKTKESVFLREMKLKPGDVYSRRTLQEDLTRIYELDFLEVDKVENAREEPGQDEGVLDITIPVTEKKTGLISAGIGYSSLQKVVGRVEFTEANFRGAGVGVNALYEVSGAGYGSSYELGFYNPWFRSDRTSLSARVYDREVYRFSSNVFGGGTDLSDADYRERRKGGTLGFSKPFGKKLKGFLTMRRETVESDVRNMENLPEGFAAISQSGDITAIAFKSTLDTRDFALDPWKGMYTSLSLEPGFSSIDGGSSGGFVKIEADFRRYIGLGKPRESFKDKRRSIALRLQMAASTGTLPFWEQFFLGGAERLRGYQEDRFWGNRMLLGSVEYRVPLGNSLTGVLFADYGDAWGDDYADIEELPDQTTSFEGHLGYGLGVRVVTPLGHLRFDYGFGDDGSRTHFSIGQAF